MKARFFTGSLIVATLAVAALACSGGASDSEPGVLDDVPVVQVHARWASANGDDIGTLLDATGTVFTGEVIGLSGQEMYETDAVDGDGPPPFPISNFSVLVQEPFFGGLVEGSTVIINQPGGLKQQADGSWIRFVVEGDDPLEVGSSYLFWATFASDGSGHLVDAPFARMSIDSGGALRSSTFWAGVAVPALLDGMGAATAATRVQASNVEAGP